MAESNIIEPQQVKNIPVSRSHIRSTCHHSQNPSEESCSAYTFLQARKCELFFSRLKVLERARKSQGKRCNGVAIKEGVMEKLCGKWTPYWSKRKCKLAGNKLYYFNLDNERRIKGVIDFDLLTCEIQIAKNESNCFRIHILKAEKVFNFRCTNATELRSWVQAVQHRIVMSKGYKNPLTKVSLQPEFWRFDRISQKQLAEIGNTGDIILFRSYGCIASVQRFITCSEVDHIGMVMKFASGQIYLLESLGKTGVAFYKWTDFTKQHWNLDYERMLYRKLHCERPQKVIEELENFITVLLLKLYDMEIGNFREETHDEYM